MAIIDTIRTILDRELNLRGAALAFSPETKLFGSIPQLDSMAVVSLISALEEALSIEFPESEMDGSVFATLESLEKCVSRIVAKSTGA